MDFSFLPTTTRSSEISFNDPTEEDPADDEDACCDYMPEMSLRERLLGCATCMAAGYILSFGSFWRIKDLATGNPLPLVLNATIGNLIALMGSCFLSGPKTQYLKMFHESRRIATIMYLGSLLTTLFVASIPHLPARGFILILLLILQYIAIFWYCLSYIPFARQAVSGFVYRQLNTTA